MDGRASTCATRAEARYPAGMISQLGMRISEGFRWSDPAETREPSDDAPFCALAFKLQTDPFVGQLTFFRVYSGTVEAGSYLYNSTTGEKERLGLSRDWKCCQHRVKATGMCKEKVPLELLFESMNGGYSLRLDGLVKVSRGTTTMEEVIKETTAVD